MYKSHVVHFQARANVTATCVTADTLVMIITSVRRAQPNCAQCNSNGPGKCDTNQCAAEYAYAASTMTCIGKLQTKFYVPFLFCLSNLSPTL